MASSRPLLLLVGGLLVAGALGGTAAFRGREAQVLPQPALEARLTEILEGVYAAYGEEEEARIYDRLATAASGDLVADLYLQRRRAQVADHAEAGETKVQGVEPFRLEAVPLADEAGYRIDAAWRVVGQVTHRTHRHERINLYAADLVVQPVEGQWKLTGFTITDIDRATDLGFEGGE